MTPTLHPLSGGDWTVRDLAEAGFADLAGWELLDGRLQKKVSKSFDHVSAIDAFFWALAAVFRTKGYTVRQESPIHIGPRDEPEPDIVVADAVASAERRHPRPDEVRLLVEIAVTTHDDDFGPRLIRNARAGVRECWVVDVVGRTLHIFTAPQPESARYAEHAILTSGEIVPELGVALSTLLP